LRSLEHLQRGRLLAAERETLPDEPGAALFERAETIHRHIEKVEPAIAPNQAGEKTFASGCWGDQVFLSTEVNGKEIVRQPIVRHERDWDNSAV